MPKTVLVIIRHCLLSPLRLTAVQRRFVAANLRRRTYFDVCRTLFRAPVSSPPTEAVRFSSPLQSAVPVQDPIAPRPLRRIGSTQSNTTATTLEVAKFWRPPSPVVTTVMSSRIASAPLAWKLDFPRPRTIKTNYPRPPKVKSDYPQPPVTQSDTRRRLLVERPPDTFICLFCCLPLPNKVATVPIPEPCTRLCDDPRVLHILAILANLFVLNHSL